MKPSEAVKKSHHDFDFELDRYFENFKLNRWDNSVQYFVKFVS